MKVFLANLLLFTLILIGLGKCQGAGPQAEVFVVSEDEERPSIGDNASDQVNTGITEALFNALAPSMAAANYQQLSVPFTVPMRNVVCEGRVEVVPYTQCHFTIAELKKEDVKKDIWVIVRSLKAFAKSDPDHYAVRYIRNRWVGEVESRLPYFFVTSKQKNNTEYIKITPNDEQDGNENDIKIDITTGTLTPFVTDALLDKCFAITTPRKGKKTISAKSLILTRKPDGSVGAKVSGCSR